ncbi:MAG: hypothetical protein WDZ89_03335 [Gemmatimonadota bacterium]
MMGDRTNGGADDGLRIDAFQIDVSLLVERNVASLYSHLVTRPTGRAVRLAIESQLVELSGTTLSLIDLSEVTVLDFSCADEVVAKLLLRYLDADRPREAFFVFRGVGEFHREPIQEVLERHALTAVAETGGGRFGLLGARLEREAEVWERIERRGRVLEPELDDVVPEREDRLALERLADRRLVLRDPRRDDFHALSTLIGGS